MFRSKYKPEDHIRIHTEAGTDVVPVFALSEDTKRVIQVGKKSIKDEINSFKDSTDFAVIQKQLVCGNETIAQAFKSGSFVAPPSAFGDSTLFPDTMAEYQRIMRKAYSSYNSIPEEIREQFNTVDDFINCPNDKLQSIFDNYNAKLQSKTDSVVTDSVVTEPVQEVKEGEV